VENIQAFTEEFYRWFQKNHGDLLSEIRETGNLSDEGQNLILREAAEFTKEKGYGK
jgi:F0F1-type ATP synthase alpha subunit